MAKTERLNIRFSAEEVADLDAVADALALGRSAALRFLIREKLRALESASSPAPAKKKRRREPA